MAGTSAVTVGLVLYRRLRKPLLFWYEWFLLSLFLLQTSFFVQWYSGSGDPPRDFFSGAVWLFLQISGAFIFILIAPFFYHALVGMTLSRRTRLVSGVLNSVLIILFFLYLIRPANVVTGVLLNLLLFGMILYGIILVAFNLSSLGDRRLRRSIVIFIILTGIFFPLMYADSMLVFLPKDHFLYILDGLAQPLYFTVLSILSVFFALRYLNIPPYTQAGTLTRYFIKRYELTGREAEIIPLLAEGVPSKEIGEKFFISAKTVDNHVYNIYRKLGIRNRVQLYRLLRINSADSEEKTDEVIPGENPPK
jgi:DNA-binding CsgD family transcriptional regulator